MIKIKPIFTTTVVKDVLNADGTLWMPKGSVVAFSSNFKTKKFGDFALLAPNPVHLLFSNVDYLIDEISKIEKIINSSNKITVFSKLVNGVNKFTTDDLLKLDPNATQIRKLDEEGLYRYLYLGASCLISLIVSVEAFVNQEIPYDFKLTVTNKKGQAETLTKGDIEFRKRLEEKLEILADILGKKDFKQQLFWNEFKSIKKLRDGFVHIKTKGSQKVDRNDELFFSILELDFIKAKKTIINLVNFFINNYIEEN